MYFGNMKYTSAWTNYFSELFIFHLLATCYNRSKIFNMKRLLLSLVFALVAFAGIAQSVSKAIPLYSDVPGKTSAQKQADTVANATSDSQTAKIAGFYSSVAVQTTLTRISGTAAGKVYFLGSLDGTDFEKADSLTVANVASQTKIFQSAPSKFVYYRIQFVGSGTQSTAFRSKAVARKQ